MYSDAEDDDNNSFPDSDVSSRSFLHPDDIQGTGSSSGGRRRHFATKIAKHYQRSKESLKEAREDLKNKDEEGRPTTFAASPTENIIAYPDYRDFKSISGFASGLQDKLFAKMIGGILPTDAVEHYSSAGSDKRKDTERPQFSVTVMSGNFRRFNQRYFSTISLYMGICHLTVELESASSSSSNIV